MTVFLAILTDSIRLLRARALFWVTLGISALAALIYLSIGFTPQGISLFFGATEIKNDWVREGSDLAELFYLGLFSKFILGLWLSWVAVGLALISCAPIYPDFMAEGSIGIPLSKPVSRPALFFYKYIGSLLFVALQVGLFCLLVFLAIRWRVGTWNPTVFYAVPLVVLVFSYLYSVVVVVAVRTRSVLAAVLAAMLVWFVSWLGQTTEQFLYLMSHDGSRDQAELREAGMGDISSDMKRWHTVCVSAMAPLPKTGETIALMDRWVKVGDQRGFANGSFVASMFGQKPHEDPAEQQLATRHSVAYVIGTSLGFEAVMLALAAWMFCRRDF